MRHIVLALLATSIMAVLGTAPAFSVGTHHPFCMQGRDHPALSDCTYASYEQCAATASGRFLSCIENPYFDPGAVSTPPSRAARAADRSRLLMSAAALRRRGDACVLANVN